MTKQKQIKFEEKFNKLNEIVEILDRAEEPLEELIMYYEEGIKLSNELKDFLEKAELKINEITEKNQLNIE